jgi:Cu(I)/Ag(I) efflux system membrane fusion protein/cobalt-zinc-cadmium efflux system membrane fusion protein
MQNIGITTAMIRRKQVTDEIRVSGNIEVDERRLAYVQVHFPGWIREVFANATYDYVRKGAPLFTIYSPELVSTEQEYLLAKQNAELLKRSSINGVASGASSLLGAAEQRLRQWEIPASEIEKLETTGKVITDLTIDSPASGYITERNVLPNMYVQPETHLYTIADLSQVWVYAQVFQTDIARIQVGNPASVTVDAYPGRVFRGRVDLIVPKVDPDTRTVRIRLAFANPDLKLKPGMFVNVDLEIPLGRKVVVPSSAVLQTGTRQIVFVDEGNGRLQPTEVGLGSRAGDEFVVMRGLHEGQTVVTSANFLIDSESQLQAATGAFIPPPPGAGAAAAMNTPAAPHAAIELITEPDPPRKGDNAIRVKLTQPGGAPVPGANVSVTFYMPAMPAMGMAALQSAVSLTETATGVYEGKLNLQSGGSWQVTIVARKDGQTLATKQINISAAGGM